MGLLTRGEPKPVKLGEKYRDTISGFTGTATARYEFLYGCVRVCLESGKDGEAKEATFDEQRLVTATVPPAKPKPTATTGGPRDNPPSRDPVR